MERIGIQFLKSDKDLKWFGKFGVLVERRDVAHESSTDIDWKLEIRSHSFLEKGHTTIHEIEKSFSNMLHIVKEINLSTMKETSPSIITLRD